MHTRQEKASVSLTKQRSIYLLRYFSVPWFLPNGLNLAGPPFQGEKIIMTENN